MNEETFDILLANEHTPMKAIKRAAIVINDDTGEVVKNRYERLPAKGSPAAEAIHAAHAAYKSAIGTDREWASYANLESVVAEARGSK